MKSNVSDYLKLMQSIYLDACIKCIADVSDLRDLETIRSRVEHEGISFLTIILPQFCRDFERSLANGVIDSTLFRNFRKYGAIPAFLQGMLSLVFNRENGRIIDDKVHISSNDVPTIVESVRQICLTFKKMELACTPERENAAIENFVNVESSFHEFSEPRDEYITFSSVSSVLWDNVLGRIDLNTMTPRHGPGATADRRSGNQKFVWRRWHERLEPYFPFIGSAYPLGIADRQEELDLVTFVKPEQEQPVRVVLVPKTLKSPRVIAIEPCCNQYVQQGIRAALYCAIESNWLSKGHVNFRDQSINQELAVTASISGQLATIDLSDASDRVPRSLAMEMFRSNPDLSGAIEACRSTRAELPDGRIIGPLGKFASMGSALCFPIEAMYFYTICVMALLRARSLPLTRRNVWDVSRGIHVYGDDIIVPSTYAMTVLDYLQKYNCKVNVNKTFVSGSFRESCGVDAYMGTQVTPVYIRTTRPENRQQASKIASWVATANAFYKKGYWRTTQFMFNQLEQVVGPLPYVSETSPGLGRISFLGYRSAERWNVDLQRLEIKALVPGPVYRIDELEGYGALMKSFLELASSKDEVQIRDDSPLERSALSGAVALTRRWVPAT